MAFVWGFQASSKVLLGWTWILANLVSNGSLAFYLTLMSYKIQCQRQRSNQWEGLPYDIPRRLRGMQGMSQDMLWPLFSLWPCNLLAALTFLCFHDIVNVDLHEACDTVFSDVCRSATWRYLLFISDVNECFSSPCRNGGQCVDGLHQYLCFCDDEFSGANCERRKFASIFLSFKETCLSKGT